MGYSRLTGADPDLLCKLALFQAMVNDSAVLMLSATKKADIAIRDTMSSVCAQHSYVPRIIVNHRACLTFENGSRIYFRVAKPWAGKGLSLSLLIINEMEAIKEIREILEAHMPAIYAFGHAIFCTSAGPRLGPFGELPAHY